jgi:cobalamin transport system ATP-binding protein
MRPAIYASEVTVELDARRIVDDVDITVGQGKWVTIIGPNGAGKTSLLRALAGILPASGRIDIFGAPVTRMSHRDRARVIAFVPQLPQVPLGMTVAHYVLLGRTAHLKPLARESTSDLDVVAKAMAQLDLTHLAERRLETLSGGEHQRAVLARSLAQEARLLLLDEPTTSLDVGHQQEILELIDTLRCRLGLTVLSTMHDLTLIAQYSDHFLLMSEGKVAISGPPVQVLTSAQLRHHYGASVDIIHHDGRLIVAPRREARSEETP